MRQSNHLVSVKHVQGWRWRKDTENWDSKFKHNETNKRIYLIFVWPCIIN